MYNTIILLKGKSNLTLNEYKNFYKGDTILGADAEPVELMRWENTSENKKAALKELSKYRCSYSRSFDNYSITEYGLEFCNYYDDEFSDGSDYDLAKEE